MNWILFVSAVIVAFGALCGLKMHGLTGYFMAVLLPLLAVIVFFGAAWLMADEGSRDATLGWVILIQVVGGVFAATLGFFGAWLARHSGHS